MTINNWKPPTQLEIDEMETAMMGKPWIRSKADLERLRKQSGLEEVDYHNINIADQVERLIKHFGLEGAPQLARANARNVELKGDTKAQLDWLEVERLIVERARKAQGS